MKLNSKVTGGLAWAGLAIVLAVPTANLLTQSNGERAGVAVAPKAPLDVASTKSELVAPIPAVRKSQNVAKTSTEKVPVTRQASVTTKKPVVRSLAKSGDPVDDFIASGKELPSYISDAPATADVKQPQVVKAPVAVTTTVTTEEVKADGTFAPQIDPIEVASVDGGETVTRVLRPSLVAPLPYPASMRPTTPTVTTATVVTTPNVTTPLTVTTPRDTTATAEKPLIIDEDIVARREALVDEVLSEDFDPAVTNDQFVSGDELEEWDSGSLAEYLERRNMISKSRTNERVVSSEPDDEFVIVDRSRSERRLVRRLRDDESEFF